MRQAARLTENLPKNSQEQNKIWEKLPVRAIRASLPRVVPWRDWAEWDSVGKALFSEERRKKLWGVERVKVWQSRGKVPHSVEATTALIEISLSHRTGANAILAYKMCPSLLFQTGVHGFCGPLFRDHARADMMPSKAPALIITPAEPKRCIRTCTTCLAMRLCLDSHAPRAIPLSI